MSIKIGHASNGENGIKGGQIGDQTGREIKIQSWYSYPWTHYLEYPSKEVAEKAAAYMEDICLDNNYGYDQGQRLTGYYAIKANGGKVKGAKGEFDCSSLVSSSYNLAGVDVSPNNSTFSMVEAFKKAGFKVYTDSEHIHTDKLATRGGIYLNETHHVVMALEDGSGAKVKTEQPIDSLKLAKDLFTKGIITDVELWHKILTGQAEAKPEWLVKAFNRVIKKG